jgi:hypothetical protein
MSGGEGNPPSIRARYGVLGHSQSSAGYRGWVNWEKKHRKRLAAIRGTSRATSDATFRPSARPAHHRHRLVPMTDGKIHLRTPNGRTRKYPRLLCTSKRARSASQAVPYRSFGTTKVKDRCKLCNAIFKRLRSPAKR